MFDVDVVLIIVGVLQYSMTTISLTLPSSWVVVPKRASRLDVMRYDGVRLAASWPMMGHCRGGGLAPDAINHCCCTLKWRAQLRDSPLEASMEWTQRIQWLSGTSTITVRIDFVAQVYHYLALVGTDIRWSISIGSSGSLSSPSTHLNSPCFRRASHLSLRPSMSLSLLVKAPISTALESNITSYHGRLSACAVCLSVVGVRNYLRNTTSSYVSHAED